MGAARTPGGGGRGKPGWEHSGKTLNLVFNLFIYLFLKGLSIFPERRGAGGHQTSPAEGHNLTSVSLPLLCGGCFFSLPRGQGTRGWRETWVERDTKLGGFGQP